MKKNISIFCKYNDSEIVEQANLMSKNLHEVNKAVIDKSEAMKEFNRTIKYFQNIVQTASENIENGGEYRDIKCEIAYNKPSLGKKTITRLDTNESWIEDMLLDEHNLFTQV